MLLALLLLPLGRLAAAGQAPATPAQSPGQAAPPAAAAAAADKPTFATGTATVVLDVVVRDKKGRSLSDLRADEIEVSEDGIRQTIEGFKRVETEPVTVGGAAPAPQPDATRQLSLVTLVFDKLGETARRQAQRGADAFVEKGLRANTYVAVFRVDQHLAMVQPFTNDRAKLKAAIAGATTGTSTGVTDEKAALEQATAELQRTAALESVSGPGAAAQGGGFAARAQAQALSNMLRLANDLQRQQMGTTSLYPLIALVRASRRSPAARRCSLTSRDTPSPASAEATSRCSKTACPRPSAASSPWRCRRSRPPERRRDASTSLDQPGARGTAGARLPDPVRRHPPEPRARGIGEGGRG